MKPQPTTIEFSFNLDKALEAHGYRIETNEDYVRAEQEISRLINAHLPAFCRIAFENLLLEYTNR